MTELLMKIFMNDRYWKNKLDKLQALMLGAEFKYKKAARLHRECADLHFEYKLARLNFEKAWKQYKDKMGWL